MKSPFQIARDWLGLHDKTTRTEVALACFLMLLLLPAIGVASLYNWLERRKLLSRKGKDISA